MGFSRDSKACRGFVFVSLALILFLAVPGCSRDDEAGLNEDAVSQAVAGHMAEGKKWLQAGEGDKARLSFLSALDLAPQNREAVYGTLVADGLHTIDVFGILFDYIKSVFVYGGPVKSLESQDPDSWINPILETMLNGLFLEHVEELVLYSELCEPFPDCSFRLDGIPIFITLEQVATLGTEFDLSEIHAFKAFSLILDGLLRHALVLDLDFDIGLAFLLAEIDFDSLEILEIVAAVVNLLLQMIEDPGHPGFLAMDEYGAEQFRHSGLHLGLGFDAFLRTFAAIEDETDPQEDDVMGYVDENENGRYDTGEPFRIPHFGVLDEEGLAWLQALSGLAASLRDSYFDETEYDPDPETRAPFQLSTLNPVLELLGLPGFMPQGLEIDFGHCYANPNTTGLKDGILDILHCLAWLLPDPPPVP